MEGSLVASSSFEQQEDSWTCQRCGWVYPNSRPSAKHRRNHKKHCGKIKGFVLQSGVHKGGSSDEASSDDGSLEKKGSLPLQSAQTPHDGIRPVEAGTVVHVVEPPSASQFRDGELLPPETNDAHIKKSEAPVHKTVEVKPEVPTYESMRNVDITDIFKANAAEHLPNISPCDETSAILGDAMELKGKDTLGHSTEIAASDIPEGYNHVARLSGPQGVDVAVPDHIDPSLQKGSMHDYATPKHAGSMTSLDEPSKIIEGEGRRSTDKNIEEFQVLEPNQSKDIKKLTTTLADELSINRSLRPELGLSRQGSSQEDDLWTCRRCGWVYPNAHPSAKHRRNHKKHCGKLERFETQTEPHKGGSSDEVSSDEEKKGHIQHDIHNESSPIIQGNNLASGLTLTGDTISSEGQSGDHCTKKEPSAEVSGEAASINDTPTSMSFSSDSIPIPESVPLAAVEDTPRTSARDEVLGQEDGGLEETITFSMDKVVERPQVTEFPTPSLDNPGVDLAEERPMAHKSDKSSDNRPASATIELQSEAIPKGGPPALVRDTPKNMLATSTNDEVLRQTDRAVEEISTSRMDRVVERLPVTEMPTQLLDNPAVDVSEERPAHITGELSSSDDRSISATIESKSEVISERGPPVSVRDTLEDTPGTSAKDEVLRQTGEGIEETTTASMDNVRDTPGTSAKGGVLHHTDGGIEETSTFSMDNVRDTQGDTPVTSAEDEVSGQKDGGIEETCTSSMDKVLERPQVTEIPAQSSDNPGVNISEERPIAHGELLSSDDRPTSATIELKSEVIPERVAPALIRDTPEGTLAASTRDEALCQIDGSAEETSTISMDKVVERPQVTEMPTLSLDNPGVDVSEERPIAHTIGGLSSSDKNSSSTTMELKSDAIPKGGLPMLVGDPVATRPEYTLATSVRDEVLGQTDGGISISSMDKVVERPHAIELPTLSSDNPGVDASEEKPLLHTPGELSSSDNNSSSTTTELKSDAIPERGPPALVGNPLGTSTIVNIADNSGLSSSPKKGGSKQSSLEENDYEENSADMFGPLEVSEKPDSKQNEFFEADFGSSGRSLDGTNGFTNAESEFPQRSEFAASSHKLSDSLEIFEDATDTLEACSLGGSVEESESLDELRQLADGVQEDSKLSRGASLDERVAGAQSPVVMDEALNEPKLRPNGMNTGEANSEEKSTTMLAGSYVAPAGMDELKAPSPEAWQEPGPSTSAKPGKKVSISEVMEDGKSDESHTALRSLMSMEGKDNMNQAAASPLVEIDPQSSGGKAASANGKKPKSRSRSFWSHCVCCPAVQ